MPKRKGDYGCMTETDEIIDEKSICIESWGLQSRYLDCLWDSFRWMKKQSLPFENGYGDDEKPYGRHEI